MKKGISVETVAAAPAILSQAIEVGGLVFVSGQIGADTGWVIPEKTIEAETRRTLENIQAILVGAELTMADIVKTTVYVVDLSRAKEINEVYRTFFVEPLPAREMVQVSALPLSAQIEISVIAARG